MKAIAVIGAGISGLAAAYFLSRKHRVHLFEREGRLGGHTHTVEVDAPDGPLRLDTGFLVHNRRTYPRLVKLFDELGVSTKPSDMSFAVSCRRSGLEYSSRGASGFFAQRQNLCRPGHFRLLFEILRFNREAPRVLTAPHADAMTVDDFLTERGFGDEFRQHYLLPMAAAIWSASIDAIRTFPALTLIRFFDNHGLLSVRSMPRWRVVVGGSDTYVPKLVAPLGDRVCRGASIESVQRHERGATVTFRDQPPMAFDEVVFACHGDQVLPLLADATPLERDVFGRFRTTTNVVCLHTDASMLPIRSRARASWNYLLDGHDAVAPTVTYDLNRLQGFRAPVRYCVTLNPQSHIADAAVLRRFVYRHPLYDRSALQAQSRWGDVSGVSHTHYCGAYWGYGFHEDGLNSALRVADTLGVAR